MMPYFSPSMQPLQNQLDFQDNEISKLQNQPNGFAIVDNNTLETILADATPEIIKADAWSEPPECSCLGFTLDVNTGRLTYVGTETIKCLIQAVASITTTQGNNRIYTVYIYKNKVQTSYKAPSSIVDNNDIKEISVMGTFENIVPNDYFELYISNLVAVNPVVIDIQFFAKSF